MTRPRGRLAREVALAASGRRRVALTHHEPRLEVERAGTPQSGRSAPGQRPVEPAAGPSAGPGAEKRRASADDALEAGEAGYPTGRRERVGAAEAELAGTAAADTWADVVTAEAIDGEPLGRGKTRKQIDRTLRGKGLYVFVAAGMHSAANAKKAKGRASARPQDGRGAVARARRSVAVHLGGAPGVV